MPEAIAPPAPAPPKPAAPPKPVAPVPAPAAKPTPEPAPAPAPAPEPEPDPFAELDAKVFGKKEPQVTETPPQPPEPAPKPGELPPQPKAPPTPKHLREELDRKNAEIKLKEEAHAKLEARIAEMEAKGKDVTILAERLATREKELETLQSELRAAKAEVSEDFKSKWDKPFNVAADRAKAIVERLTITTGVDEDTGEPKVRQATWDDFVRLYSMPEGQDILAAKKVFGDASSIVEMHLARLKEMDYTRQQALQEEKAQWKEKETARQAEQIKQQEAYNAALEQARKQMVQKHADWFDEVPADDKGNEILRESRRLLEAKPRTFQEAVALMVRNRLNAESAPRERWRNEQLKAKVAELEATIEEMKSSRPGPGTRSSSEGERPGTQQDELDELNKIFENSGR